MRISGGTAKGRRTAAKRLITRTSSGDRLRPTSSKVREALFDILRSGIEGTCFVDLYAGTGTVGFEALSRGAGEVVFVEPNEAVFKSIGKSAVELGFRDRCRIVKGRADDFLRKAVADVESFDIFFIDPPYQSDEIEKVLPLIGESDILKEGGAVIVEHFWKKKLPDSVGKLKMKKIYRYGDTVLTLYRKAEK